MTAYLFDAAAIARRYVRERGTDWILALAEPAAGHRLYLVGLTGVEVLSALTRYHRAGELSASDLATASAQFRVDWATQYRVLELTRGLLERSMTLAEAHGLRTYEAVQLAAALEVNRLRLASALPALVLVAGEPTLRGAAQDEGLTVEDPGAHA